MKGCEKTFELDASHAFPVGKPVPVSGNTAAMVGEGGVSWLSSRFKVRCLHVCVSTISFYSGLIDAEKVLGFPEWCP